ncbi:hypothetical protein CI102_13974 [Trichoderma harzianum]|nr:hypothetical protein CI102_13974 [Trichoderma harzianum]
MLRPGSNNQRCPRTRAAREASCACTCACMCLRVRCVAVCCAAVTSISPFPIPPLAYVRIPLCMRRITSIVSILYLLHILLCPFMSGGLISASVVGSLYICRASYLHFPEWPWISLFIPGPRPFFPLLACNKRPGSFDNLITQGPFFCPQPFSTVSHTYKELPPLHTVI